jgi:hypothetical protein
MQKFLFQLSLFLVIFLVPIYIIGSLDRYAENEQAFDLRRLSCAAKQDSLALLFLGSSYSYSSINPQAFDSLGLKSYNLAISGTGVYFTELIINDYAAHCDKLPKWLIFDISLLSFSDKSDDFLAYPVHRYLQKAYSHEELLYHYGQRENYLPMLAKSFLKGLSAIWANQKQSDCSNSEDSIWLYRGFYANYQVRAENLEAEEQKMRTLLHNSKFDAQKFKTLLSLMQYYQKKGCKIYWYQPTVGKLANFFSKEFNADFSAAIALLRKSDFMREIPIDTTVLKQNDFRNTDHLNFFGAQKISRQMAGFLANELK